MGGDVVTLGLPYTGGERSVKRFLKERHGSTILGAHSQGVFGAVEGVPRVADIEAHDVQVRRLQSQIDDLSKEKQALQRQNEQLRSEPAPTSQDEVDRLKEDASYWRRKWEQVNRESTDLQQEVARLQTRVNTLAATPSAPPPSPMSPTPDAAVLAQLVALRRDKEALEGRLSDEIRKGDQMRQLLRESVQEFDNYERRIKEIERLNVRLQQELTESLVSTRYAEVGKDLLQSTREDNQRLLRQIQAMGNTLRRQTGTANDKIRQIEEMRDKERRECMEQIDALRVELQKERRFRLEALRSENLRAPPTTPATPVPGMPSLRPTTIAEVRPGIPVSPLVSTPGTPSSPATPPDATTPVTPAPIRGFDPDVGIADMSLSALLGESSEFQGESTLSFNELDNDVRGTLQIFAGEEDPAPDVLYPPTSATGKKAEEETGLFNRVKSILY